jgi:glycosyltransferase involved in cell wall biosynthesis
VKILLVAMAESIHAARWVAQLPVDEWDVHVFPSTAAGGAHPELRGVTLHGLLRAGAHPGIREGGLPVPHPRLASLGEEAADGLLPWLRPYLLARLVRELRPDVVHSLEFQHSSYLTLRARERSGDAFPPWIVTNWGSDIQRFGEDPAHAPRIREVLRSCDAYTCECERDVGLARAMGFTGRTFPPSPNGGGFDLARADALRSGPPSRRTGIVLKGYQGWAGRALVAIEALGAVRDLLAGRRLTVFSAAPEVAAAARALAARSGLALEIRTPRDPLPHEEMLRRHGEARVSLGLSTSDGISTSFLEAMVMGSFPVQSWTSCAGEWIVDGQSGILVPPEDPAPVAAALRRALTDDRLVDAAADRNRAEAGRRLDGPTLARAARALYEEVRVA